MGVLPYATPGLASPTWPNLPVLFCSRNDPKSVFDRSSDICKSPAMWLIRRVWFCQRLDMHAYWQVDRGSILQCIVGLVVASTVFVLMVRDMPYVDPKTNVLSIMGQLLVVLSFFSALLLRVDLSAESFSADTIGTVMMLSNVPLVSAYSYGHRGKQYHSLDTV